MYTATPPGRAAAARWLHQPVEHVRDIRSHLLLKLALLDRAGDDPADLLEAQRAVLEPIVAAIEARHAASAGFDATLLAWRRATAVAALDFIDRIRPASSQTDSSPAVSAVRRRRRSAAVRRRRRSAATRCPTSSGAAPPR